MADLPFDFAVLGSTPLGGLLAGLLAQAHGKRVVLLRETASPFRLARGFDLSVGPITRPETWALLGRTTPEVLGLLPEIGRGLARRIDPRMLATTPAGVEALAHIRHVAAGFGYVVERLASPAGATCRFRDAALLDRARLAPALEAWCENLGILRLAPASVSLSFKRDGSVRIEAREGTIGASHAILADDAAILAHLGAASPERRRSDPAISLLTEPARALESPLMIHIDSGVVLAQSASGAIAATAPGRHTEALQRIGIALAGHGEVRRAGEVAFTTVGTTDGAPVVGTARSPRVSMIAGLGLSGAFLAPALARLFAGAASADEIGYFGAREAGKGRAVVADYGPTPALGAAA